MRLVIWIIKGVAALAAFGVTSIGILLGVLWLEHNTGITLPAPSGPHAIARNSFAWRDAAQSDRLAPLPGAPRELVGWIWYPAAIESASAARADYSPAPWRTAIEHQRGPLINNFLMRDLSRVGVHSASNADVSAQETAYPVVIMRGGLATLTTEYTILAEDLASHGYIVVGFDAPYRSAITVFPDGRVIKRTQENNAEAFAGDEQTRVVNMLLTAWSADVAFVLDQLEQLNDADSSGKFTGRLDMSRVGVFGHSLGGATALQFCHDDARCKVGINIDGAPYGSVIADGLDQPFMFIMADHGDMTDAVGREIEANIRSIYDRLAPEDRVRIKILGANHFNFSDGALLRSQMAQRVMRMLGILRLDGGRQLAITTHSVHRFFDAYLKETPVSGFEVLSPLYPEIELVE